MHVKYINTKITTIIIFFRYTSCNVHPTCARLATAELLNFQLIDFDEQRKSLSGRARERLKSLGMKNKLTITECKELVKGDSNDYASCWVRAIEHICAENKSCCPTDAIHQACSSNKDSSECRKICVKV